MSALGRKADITLSDCDVRSYPKAVTLCAERDVRLVPIADIQARPEREKKICTYPDVTNPPVFSPAGPKSNRCQMTVAVTTRSRTGRYRHAVRRNIRSHHSSRSQVDHSSRSQADRSNAAHVSV